MEVSYLFYFKRFLGLVSSLVTVKRRMQIGQVQETQMYPTSRTKKVYIQTEGELLSLRIYAQNQVKKLTTKTMSERRMDLDLERIQLRCQRLHQFSHLELGLTQA